MWRGRWASGAVAAFVLVCAIGLGLGLAATGARGQAPGEVAVSWDVAEAGIDNESLEVYVQYGGCVRPPFRPVVEETATSVTITMLATSIAAPGVACTEELRRGLARVALAGSLNGRSIRGRRDPTGIDPTSFVDPPGRRARRLRMPNLVGLNLFEARRALRLRGLRVRVRSSRGHGGRTQIRGQAPGAGRPVARHGVARLLLGLP